MGLDGRMILTEDAKIMGVGQTGANVRFVVGENYKLQDVWKSQ